MDMPTIEHTSISSVHPVHVQGQLHEEGHVR